MGIGMEMEMEMEMEMKSKSKSRSEIRGFDRADATTCKCFAGVL